MTITTEDKRDKKPLDKKAILALIGGGALALGALVFTVVAVNGGDKKPGKKAGTAEEQSILDKQAKAQAEAEREGAKVKQQAAGSGMKVDEEGNILGQQPGNVTPELKNAAFEDVSETIPQIRDEIRSPRSEDRYYNSERFRDEREAKKDERSLVNASSLSYSTNPGANYANTRPQGGNGGGSSARKTASDDPTAESQERVEKLIGAAERMMQNAPATEGGGEVSAPRAVAGVTGNVMPAQRMPVPAALGDVADMRIGGGVGPDDIIREGKFLDGVMVNRIESDIAESPVIVQLSRDFVSLDGKTVLFPAGSMCYGTAGTVGNMQQARIYVKFHKVVFPRRHGDAIQPVAYFPVRNMPPVLDNLGSVGVKDKLNRHFMLKFGAAVVMGIFDGLAASVQGGNPDAQYPSTRDMIAARTSQNFQMVMGQIIQSYANVVPTITIREGKKVKIYFTQDTMVSPYMLTKDLSFVRRR